MNSFTIVLEKANSVLGLALNSLLLYAIQRFSGAILGTYKHLLTIFTLTDVFLVVLHVLMSPRITALFIALQSVPFILLGIHFHYRYWYCLCLYGSTGQDDSAGRRDVIADYERKFGKRIVNAWIVFDYWRDDRIDTVLLVTYLVMNVMTTSLILATSFAVLTFHHMKRAQKISAQAVQLQRKLLIALCAQASVPAIFVYIPHIFTINIPFWRIPITFVHDASVPLTTRFTVLDAAVMILLMSDYRRGLIGLVKKQQKSEESVIEVSVTVVQNISAVGH